MAADGGVDGVDFEGFEMLDNGLCGVFLLERELGVRVEPFVFIYR